MLAKHCLRFGEIGSGVGVEAVEIERIKVESSNKNVMIYSISYQAENMTLLLFIDSKIIFFHYKAKDRNVYNHL